MDLASLPAPTFTAIDGITQGTGAIVYLVVGIAAWIRAARDIRTRVFLAFSLTNVVVLGIPTYWWLRGLTDPTKLPPLATVIELAALGEGALLLFHFTQVFPRRRPWIRESGVQMSIAYCLVPAAIAGLLWFAPATMDKLNTSYILAMIVFGFPLVVLLGAVLPVAGIVSLLRSHRELHASAFAHLRSPLELILLSQIAGGTLAILFAPVLAVLAPNSIMQSVLTVVIWVLSLMTPIAYAWSVFRLNVLEVDPA